MSAPSMLDVDLGEDLCDRLRDLAERYPKGLGLVKEFLQNADDAGATYLRVLYDRRQHTGTLPDPEMDVALGPALLFVNDRSFDLEDIRRIHRISDSGKVADAGRTGRFGQGFNTSYSISDHPSLVTGNRIIWFDPHRRIQGRMRNSYPWDLAEAAVLWPAWLTTFLPAQVASDGRPFAGAAFRLPLRNHKEAERSKIRRGEPFLHEHFDAIVEEVQRTGPPLLLFLRSVLTLELSEIDAEGREQLRLRITTQNTEEVEAARARLRAGIRGEPVLLLESWLRSSEPPPVAKYTHTFFITRGPEPSETQSWEVVTGIFRGTDDALLKHALALSGRPGSREKAIPWAGAAAPSSADTRGGMLSCFLPLPESSHYPVWLHGWFAVDSARRGIARTSEVDELIQQRVKWNEQLMRHAVGPAWAQLLVRLRDSPGAPASPYANFPNDPAHQDGLDQALREGFYATASALPLFRGHGTQQEWVKPDALHWNIPAASHDALAEPLRAASCVIAVPPLPVTIDRGLARAKAPVRALTPKALREYLMSTCNALTFECTPSESPTPLLSKPDRIIALARFCAQDGPEHLTGLPLALCTDGKLRRFDVARTLWIAAESQRALLSPIPNRQLDPGLVTAAVKGQSVPKAGVRTVDTTGLLDIIQTVLSIGTPEAAWLEAAFELLGQVPPAQLEPHREPLQALRLLPNQSAQHVMMGKMATPLLPGATDADLLASLQRLRLPIVTGPPQLVAAVARFASRHPNYVWSVTTTDVADMLASVSVGATLDWTALAEASVRGPLLDLLSKPGWMDTTDKRLSSLRALSLLPTMNGELVAASSPHVYIPTGFTPPEGVGGDLKLLDLGEGGRWKPLAEMLGVPPLSGLRFVRDVLLPELRTAAPAQQDRLLLWLRDELPLVERQLKDDERQALLRELRQSPLLPANTGELCAPIRIYAPGAEEPEELLGPLARKPDRSRFSRQWEMWNQFFERLQLPRKPLAIDLLERIDGLIGLASAQGVAAAAPMVHLIAKHIAKNWRELEGIQVRGSKTLARCLRELQWLPARSMDAAECTGARVPEARLYLPRELAQGSLRHLLASVSLVYYEGDLSVEMAREIGVRTTAEPVDVLAHLDSIRKLHPASGTKAAQTLSRGFKEILKYIGALDVKETALIHGELERLKPEPILLVRGQWWRPARVFMKRMADAIPGAITIAEDTELLRAVDDSLVSTGLHRLGVRESPSSEDWLEVLENLSKAHAEQPLPPGKGALARTALAAIAHADADWLQAVNPWIMTAEARLVRALDAFIPDDARLKTLALKSPIHLVEAIEPIQTVARRAGTPSLHASLTERLKDVNEESEQPETTRWKGLHTRRFQSVEFYEALRRIVYDNAFSSTDEMDDPMQLAARPALQAARRLRLKVASLLQVEVVLDDLAETIIFEHPSASFFNESEHVLWLHAGKPRRMFDELVRAICRLCQVTDTLRVSRLLEAEPEEMHALLDEEGVAVVSDGVTMPHPNTSAAQQQGARSDEDETQERPLEEDEVVTSSAMDPAGHEGVYSQPAAYMPECPSPSYAFPVQGHRYDPLRPVDPDAPRPLGDGSSHPWVAGGTGPAGSGVSSARLGGSGHARPMPDYDTGTADPAALIEVQRAAVEQVRTWEQKRGRPVQDAAPGSTWELVSGEGDQQRKIKVRGLTGPWTARGIALTRAHLDKARQEGSSWWLYVVEHALDPQRVSILSIPNPATNMTEIRIGSDWRTTAEGENPQDSSPQRGDRVELSEGQSAVVVDVDDTFAPLFDVTLRMEDGSTRTCVWQPHWKRRS